MENNNDSANIVVVTRYKDITSEIMLTMLKSGLNEFKFSFFDEQSKLYEKETVDLIREYIYKLENVMPNVSVIRSANRGLEALMSIREDRALKNSCEIWSDSNGKSFKEKLTDDRLNDAICEIVDKVYELVHNANFEDLWKNMNYWAKNDLLKDWNMDWKDCTNDEVLSFGLFTKREISTFEGIIGIDFEEFDQYLRV